MLKLTEEHVARALQIAHWYGRRARQAEISDLESAALEGLVKAARDFDPDGVPRGERRVRGRRSFWNFAFKRILGEMKDELRRFDHLTRRQRAMVTEDENGMLAVERDDLSWMNPQEPLSLHTSIADDEGQRTSAIVDLIEEPRNAIEEFELRDAFSRAGAELPERERFVFVKRELEGYSNSELADAFDVSEGRASQLRASALDQMQKEIGDSLLDAA